MGLPLYRIWIVASWVIALGWADFLNKKGLTWTDILQRGCPRSLYCHPDHPKSVCYLLRSIRSSWQSICANQSYGVVPGSTNPKLQSHRLQNLRRPFPSGQTHIWQGYSCLCGSDSEELLPSWPKWHWRTDWPLRGKLCLNKSISTGWFVHEITGFGNDLSHVVGKLIRIVNLHHCLIIIIS